VIEHQSNGEGSDVVARRWRHM